MNWIYLAHEGVRLRALVNAVMNLRVPHNAGCFLTSWELVSYSRRPLPPAVSKLKNKTHTSRDLHFS